MAIDIHTLAGAYALDAVDDIERAAFDRHLTECPSCAQELAEFRATVARLTDLNSVTPPASLKPSVLAAAGRTRQAPPGSRSADRARRRGWRTWVAATVAAAVIAVAGGGIGYAISDRNTRAAQVTVAQDAKVSAILAAPDATVHQQSMPGGGEISVVVAPSLDQGVAIVSNMPDVPPSRSYQLWLLHGAKPASAGAMPGGSTSGTVLLHNVRGAGALAISLERAGGAPIPTDVVGSFGI
jgi:anti-sigma-K factor RskA